MNYETVRKAFGSTLRSVPGIGKVFEHQRHTSDWPTFVERFRVPSLIDPEQDVISFAWCSRRSSTEEQTNDEAYVPVSVEVREDWEVVVVDGYQDDDDEDRASEATFNDIVDGVKAAFRWGLADPPSPSYPDVTLSVGGVAVEQSGLFSEGELLVHKAVIRVTVIQHTTTVA